MTDYDYRVLIIHQEMLEPGACLDIQMVGRLIQQQRIRLSKQRLCQQHLYLITTGQLLHQYIMQIH